MSRPIATGVPPPVGGPPPGAIVGPPPGAKIKKEKGGFLGLFPKKHVATPPGVVPIFAPDGQVPFLNNDSPAHRFAPPPRPVPAEQVVVKEVHHHHHEAPAPAAGHTYPVVVSELVHHRDPDPFVDLRDHLAEYLHFASEQTMTLQELRIALHEALETEAIQKSRIAELSAEMEQVGYIHHQKAYPALEGHHHHHGLHEHDHGHSHGYPVHGDPHHHHEPTIVHDHHHHHDLHSHAHHSEEDEHEIVVQEACGAISVKGIWTEVGHGAPLRARLPTHIMSSLTNPHGHHELHHIDSPHHHPGGHGHIHGHSHGGHVESHNTDGSHDPYITSGAQGWRQGTGSHGEMVSVGAWGNVESGPPPPAPGSTVMPSQVAYSSSGWVDRILPEGSGPDPLLPMQGRAGGRRRPPPTQAPIW